MSVLYKNFTKCLIKNNASIKDAMKKMNDIGKGDKIIKNYQFLLLVDKTNKLIGTITDGDIRRSILRGESLNSSVIKATNMNPIYGLEKEYENNNALLNSILHETFFLPILNKNMQVIDALVSDSSYLNKNISVLLMAGGFGKRLGNLTKNTPKPLIKKNGKAIIDNVLDIINKCNLVTKLYISTHYLSSLLKEHVNSRIFKFPIKYLYEDTPLGTAGSLSLLDNKLKENNILVINADLITNIDLNNLIDYHNISKNDATIAVAEYTYKIPYGVIEYSSSGSFLELIEKPDINKFVAAGIYVLSPKFKSLLSLEEVIDMPDLINRGRKNNLAIGVFPIYEEWSDIGSPEDL